MEKGNPEHALPSMTSQQSLRLLCSATSAKVKTLLCSPISSSTNCPTLSTQSVDLKRKQRWGWLVWVKNNKVWFQCDVSQCAGLVRGGGVWLDVTNLFLSDLTLSSPDFLLYFTFTRLLFTVITENYCANPTSVLFAHWIDDVN